MNVKARAMGAGQACAQRAALAAGSRYGRPGGLVLSGC